VLNQLTPISTSQIRSLKTTRPVILTIILLVWVGLPVVAWPPNPLTTQTGDGARGAVQSADEGLSLEPGKPVERELSGGQSHFYKLTMTPGQYLQVTVSQQGIDTLLALFTPDGKKVGEGKVAATAAMVFSADDGCDVGEDTGAPVSPDYGPRGNAFSGRVKGVQIAIAEAAEAVDHLVSPEEAIRIAMARQ